METFVAFMVVYFCLEAIVAFSRADKPGLKRDVVLAKMIEGLIYVGFAVWGGVKLGFFN